MEIPILKLLSCKKNFSLLLNYLVIIVNVLYIFLNKS